MKFLEPFEGILMVTYETVIVLGLYLWRYSVFCLTFKNTPPDNLKLIQHCKSTILQQQQKNFKYTPDRW